MCPHTPPCVLIPLFVLLFATAPAVHQVVQLSCLYLTNSRLGRAVARHCLSRAAHARADFVLLMGSDSSGARPQAEAAHEGIIQIHIEQRDWHAVVSWSERLRLLNPLNEQAHAALAAASAAATSVADAAAAMVASADASTRAQPISSVSAGGSQRENAKCEAPAQPATAQGTPESPVPRAPARWPGAVDDDGGGGGEPSEFRVAIRESRRLRSLFSSALLEGAVASASATVGAEAAESAGPASTRAQLAEAQAQSAVRVIIERVLRRRPALDELEAELSAALALCRQARSASCQ